MHSVGGTKRMSRARAECGVLLFWNLWESWPRDLHCPLFHLAFSSIACACRGLGWSPGDTIDLEQSNKKRRGRYREYIPADWLTSATEPIFTSFLMLS